MAEEEIRIPFNKHKLDALKIALYYAGKNYDKEIAALLENFYTSNVPAKERAEVERQIQEDAVKAEEQENQFIVVRINSDDKSLCLKANWCNDFYESGSRCKQMLEDIERWPLEELMGYFIESVTLDEDVYEIVTNASNASRVKAVMEFDFDDCVLSIKEQGDTRARHYVMEDVTKAFRSAEAIPGISEEKREELFRKQLRGREIEFAEPEEMKPSQL